MLGWFQALMPKEDALLRALRAARHDRRRRRRGIARSAAGRRTRSSITAGRLSNARAEADEITRQVLTAVRRTFITPFDRTDIQDLATSMDDAIDQMNKTAKVITLFEVRSFDPQMQQMGEIILQAAKLVLEAMPLLSSIGKNAASSTRLPRRSSASRSTPTSSTSRAARRCFSPIARATHKAMR